MYLNVCVSDKFELPKMAKNEVSDFSPNLSQLGLFYPYFVCKCSFIEIPIIIIIILKQNKQIWLILKTKKSKIQNLKFVNCTFFIHKNGNNTSKQPIIKLNFTYCMFNINFCGMNMKKVPVMGAGKKGGTIF